MDKAAIKSVSAHEPRRSQRDKNRNQRANVQWRRLKDNFDDLVNRTSASPEIGSVITRWVLFGHLTRGEGYAARLVGEIVGRYEAFWNAQNVNRTPGSPAFERGTAGATDEIARLERDGTIADYERRAKRAKRRYNRLMSMLGRYPGAQEPLWEVCVYDREIASDLRGDVATVLRVVGKEFGVIDVIGRRHPKVWRSDQ